MPNEDGGEGQIKEPIYDPESGDTGTGPMGWVIATYPAPDRIESGPLDPGGRSEGIGGRSYRLVRGAAC